MKKRGKVKFYKADKGYGFIINDSDQKDYFFHIKKVLSPTIQKDDLVEYDIVETKRGLQCINVKLL